MVGGAAGGRTLVGARRPRVALFKDELKDRPRGVHRDVGPHREDSVFNAGPSVIPAGIALVAATILLAPRESEVGLLETAVTGFVLELAAMLLPANGGRRWLWARTAHNTMGL